MPTLDHRTIDADSLVERYVTGRLPEAEADRFEEHLLECAECIERVEAAERLQAGLVRVAMEDAVAAGAAAGILAVVARAMRRRPLGWAAAAAAAFVVVAASGAWQWWRAEQMEGWRAPAAGMPVTLLTPLRGSEQPFPVELPSEGRWVGLWVEPGGDELPAYRAVLRDPGGEEAWRGEALGLNDLGALLIQLPADLLAPGEWELVVEGFAPGGGPVPVASFPLAVRPPGGGS